MGKKIIIVLPKVFTSQELKEYEKQILDNKKLTEQQASRFFLKFPKFLTIGGYFKITREVVLYKSSGEALYRVDFCRRRFGEMYWDFVELKSPKSPFIIKKGNHWKFSSEIETGIHQAKDYSDFLENDLNRLELKKRTGINAFRPKILLVGGRKDNNINPIIFKSLISRYNNIDIKCYDDIYNFALENYNTSLITVPVIQNWNIPFPDTVFSKENMNEILNLISRAHININIVTRCIEKNLYGREIIQALNDAIKRGIEVEIITEEEVKPQFLQSIKRRIYEGKISIYELKYHKVSSYFTVIDGLDVRIEKRDKVKYYFSNRRLGYIAKSKFAEIREKAFRVTVI